MKQENSYIVDNELPTDIPTLSYENQPLMFDNITIDTSETTTATTCPVIDCIVIYNAYSVREEVNMVEMKVDEQTNDYKIVQKRLSDGYYEVITTEQSPAGYFSGTVPGDIKTLNIDFGTAVLEADDLKNTTYEDFDFTFNKSILCTFGRRLDSKEAHKLLSMESVGQIESKMTDKFYHTPITEYFKYRYETIPFTYCTLDSTIYMSEYWPDLNVYNFEYGIIENKQVSGEQLRALYIRYNDLSGRLISHITNKLSHLSSVPHERYLCTYHWDIKNRYTGGTLSLTKITSIIRYPIAYMGPIDNLDEHLTNFTLFNYITSTTNLEVKWPINITTIRLKGVKNCYIKDTMVKDVAIVSRDDVNVVYDKQLNTLTKTTDDTNINTYTITRNRLIQQWLSTQKCIDDDVEPIVLEPVNASTIQPSPIYIPPY